MKTPFTDDSAARSGGNAVVSVLGLSAQQISGFVITLLAAGFLSAAEYGVYTLAIVFVEFVVMLTYTGFFHFIVTSDARDDAVLPTMFWVMVAIGTCGGAMMILFATPIATFFDVPELAPILVLFGMMQPFASGISWGAAQLTRAGLMRRYFLILIAANAFALVAGSLVLVLWHSLYALALYRATRLVFSLVLFGLNVPTLPRFHFDLGLFREAWRYALGLYGARTLTFFSMFGTDLVLAYLFSTAASGQYRFANQLATSTVDIIAHPLRSFSLKSFGAAARKGTSLTPVFNAYFPGMLFLVGGVALTVFVLGGALIETLFRPEYFAAVGAVQALSLRACARVGQNMVEPTFSATKRTGVAFTHNLILTSAMLATILCVAPFGFIQVAWAQAVLQIASVPVSLWVIARYAPVDIRPSLHSALQAMIVLICYGAALWLVWQLIGLTDFRGGMKLGLGLAAVPVLAAVASAVAYRIGMLKPQIFAD